MAILPVDIQALLVRMDSVSKMQQMQQEGVVLAQAVKGGELSELSQIESSRVNDVKPHPDGNNKIEDEQKKQKKGYVQKRKKNGGGKKEEERKKFEEPYKGTHVDIKR